MITGFIKPRYNVSLWETRSCIGVQDVDAQSLTSEEEHMVYDITMKYDTTTNEWILGCKQHPHLSFIHSNLRKAFKGMAKLLEEIEKEFVTPTKEKTKKAKSEHKYHPDRDVCTECGVSKKSAEFMAEDHEVWVNSAYQEQRTVKGNKSWLKCKPREGVVIGYAK